MRKIFPLPEHIIAQIAAGEVIERPAYALKELVENSIDAKATNIQIFLEDAGLKKIMVTDDGEGMTREDLAECYKHHTTSKFSAAKNLIGIKSLGFRGEALSSIASVSHTIIKSRTADDQAGTEITIDVGKPVITKSIGMPRGTTVVIENLFGAVPARKKFLKSKRTEFRHCLEMVMQTALAHPYIRIQFIHNNRTVLDFPKSDNGTERVKSMFGNDLFSQMVPVISENEFVKIYGFISKPHLISSSTNKQYIIINNRNIFDKKISQSVKEGYGTLLDNNSYPLFILLIHLPFEMVDINVHPRKEQVILLREQLILDFIREAVTRILKENNVTFTAFSWKNNNGDNNMPAFATSILRDEILPWEIQNLARLMKSSDIVQLHNVYLLAQTYNGILFVDQHAAHERILYEKYNLAFSKQKSSPKKISLPEAMVITTSPQDLEIILTNKTLFDKIGFTVEEFGNDAIQITHISEFFKDHNLKKLLMEMIEDLRNGELKQVDLQSQTMLAYLACRGAIKAGDKLTKIQCKELLEQLEKTPNNYTCPHGRPTKVEIPLRNIHKFFKR